MSPTTETEKASNAQLRKRLLTDGANVLDTDELLALIVVTGRGSGLTSQELATRVLADLGGADALAHADAPALRSVVGIGPNRASRILAAIELGLRLSAYDPLPHPPPELSAAPRAFAPEAPSPRGPRSDDAAPTAAASHAQK